MIEALNNYSALITAVATVGLLAATFVLAVVTRQLFKEQQKISQPDVVVSVEQNLRHPTVLDFVIENIGGGIAYDVQISVLKDIKSEWAKGDKESLGNMPFLKQQFLKPRTRLYKMLGTYWVLETKEGDFEVSFKNKNGEQFTNKFFVDLTQFEQLTASDSFENDLLKSLSKISDSLQKFTSGRIKVDAFNARDRIEEKMRMEELMEERKKKKAS